MQVVVSVLNYQYLMTGLSAVLRRFLLALKLYPKMLTLATYMVLRMLPKPIYYNPWSSLYIYMYMLYMFICPYTKIVYTVDS